MSTTTTTPTLMPPTYLTPTPVKPTAAPAAAVLPKWVTISIAGSSGAVAWLFTHPFEVIKNTSMMATVGPGGAGAGKPTLMECVRRARAKGLYTGLSSGVLRQCVYSPARLGCYPIIRDVIARDTAHPAALERAVAGASAGVLASCISSPVEVCLVLQTTRADKPSIARAAGDVLSQSGVAGFWRGIGALASRAAMVGVCQVAVHDQVLFYLRRWNARRARPYHDQNVVVNTASVITAFIYAFFTMPFEIARVRMSAQASSSRGASPAAALKYRNVVQTIGLIGKEEGVRAVYDAFAPYFMRCAVHTVICFFAIELVTATARARRQAALAA